MQFEIYRSLTIAMMSAYTHIDYYYVGEASLKQKVREISKKGIDVVFDPGTAVTFQ
jgi:hypothetical protein